MFVVTLSEIVGFALIALMILVWAVWMASRMVAALLRRRAEPWNRKNRRKP